MVGSDTVADVGVTVLVSAGWAWGNLGSEGSGCSTDITVVVLMVVQK